MVNLRCSSKSPFALKINRKKYTFKELYLTERITADHLKVFAVFLRGGELACLPCSVELPVSSPSHNNNNKTLKRKQGMSLASPEKQQIPVLLRASSPHINGLGVLSCLAKKNKFRPVNSATRLTLIRYYFCNNKLIVSNLFLVYSLIMPEERKCAVRYNVNILLSLFCY